MAPGKRLAPLLLLCCLRCPLPAAAPEAPAPGFARFTLENGLRVILQEKRNHPLTAMTLAVDLAPAAAAPAGWPHLLEHLLLFGATAAADGPARLAALRERGVSSNAHTDSDLMTFEYCAPAAQAEWALQQLREQLFSPRPQAEHLQAEKLILAEEIAQLHDNPETAARLLALRRLFGSHPYARPVEGEPQTVAAAGAADMEQLRLLLLAPPRCALAVVGDFDAARMEAAVRRIWGPLAAADAAPPAPLAAAPGLPKSLDEVLALDVQQAHLFVAWPAAAFNDADRGALTLLTFVLGRGLNPLLANALNNPRDLVDRLEMRYQPLRRGGALLLHLMLPARNIRSVKSELTRFLGNIRNVNFSRRDYLPEYQERVFDMLDSARCQLALEGEKYQESALNLSAAAARFLLLDDRPDDASSGDELEKMRSGDLRRVAGKYLSGKKWVTVAVVPVKE